MALRVGVLGAGYAGLGAAFRLAARGCSVRALEARTRAGGRASTATVGGYDVDMGPMWLHGVARHPLLPYVERLNMTLARTDYESASAYNGSAAAARAGRAALGAETLAAWYAAWDAQLRATTGVFNVTSLSSG